MPSYTNADVARPAIDNLMDGYDAGVIDVRHDSKQYTITDNGRDLLVVRPADGELHVYLDDGDGVSLTNVSDASQFRDLVDIVRSKVGVSSDSYDTFYANSLLG